ncbi:hypothetical protein LXL04_018219 [Taraxacum kok-saghyz]
MIKGVPEFAGVLWKERIQSTSPLLLPSNPSAACSLPDAIARQREIPDVLSQISTFSNHSNPSAGCNHRRTIAAIGADEPSRGSRNRGAATMKSRNRPLIMLFVFVVVRGICPQIISFDRTWMNKATKQKKSHQIHKNEEESIDSD